MSVRENPAHVDQSGFHNTERQNYPVYSLYSVQWKIGLHLFCIKILMHSQILTL